MITNDEYLATQMQLAAFEVVPTRMPLAEFLERARHAEALGPILDPTLYREASDKLQHVITVAEALSEAKSRIVLSAETRRPKEEA